MNSNMKGWQMSIVASFLFYEGEFESCIQEGDLFNLFICKGWMFPYSNHPLHIALRHSQILNVEASQHLFFSSRTRCHLRFAGGKWLRWVGYLSLFRSSNQHRATSNGDNRGVDQSTVEQHAQLLTITMIYIYRLFALSGTILTPSISEDDVVPWKICGIRNQDWRPQFLSFPCVAAGERETFLSLHWTWSQLCGLSLTNRGEHHGVGIGHSVIVNILAWW